MVEKFNLTEEEVNVYSDGCGAAVCGVNACPLNGCVGDACMANLTPLPGPFSNNDN